MLKKGQLVRWVVDYRAFEAYDEDGDGFISKEEMMAYLTNVFTAMFAVYPQLATPSRATPRSLAAATAEQAFEEAGLNHDGRLSFEEFRKWYTAPDAGEG